MGERKELSFYDEDFGKVIAYGIGTMQVETSTKQFSKLLHFITFKCDSDGDVFWSLCLEHGDHDEDVDCKKSINGMLQMCLHTFNIVAQQEGERGNIENLIIPDDGTSGSFSGFWDLYRRCEAELEKEVELEDCTVQNSKEKVSMSVCFKSMNPVVCNY